MSDLCIFWTDSETTGLDAGIHAPIQIAAIVEKNNEIIDEIEFTLAPFEGAQISQKALEVNRRTEKEIYGFAPAKEQLAMFKQFMDKYVDKYNRHDKFIAAGKNVRFDLAMYSGAYKKIGDDYFWSYFFPCALDLEFMWALVYKNTNIRLKNLKLLTICNYLGIKLGDKAHDAMADIKATREAYFATVNLLKK